MTGTAPDLAAPDLAARLQLAAAAAPEAPTLRTEAAVLTRRDLLARIRGCAMAAAGRDLVLSPDDAAVWLPWLAGAALGGGRAAFGLGGERVPPPLADAWPAPVPPGTPFMKVQTSGTTGRPTALLRDRAGWLRCFAAEEAALGLEPGDRILALGLPAFSLTPYVALRALHLGAALGVLTRVRRQASAAVLTALAPTVVYGVPPLVTALAQASRPLDLAVRDGVRLVVVGGARLTPAQAAIMAGAWPSARIVTFYGTAEASFITLNTQPDPTRPGDVGRPFPAVDIESEGDGRLWVRTPYAALARLDADGTEHPLADADGWIALADRGRVTDSGRLSLLGRSDGLLNIGGALCDPAPAECALERLPWVAEAVVFAAPDPARSEMAVAAVLAAGPPPADASGQLAGALRDFEVALRPRRLLVVADDLPRTPGGKPDRAALAEAWTAGRLDRRIVA